MSRKILLFVGCLVLLFTTIFCIHVFLDEPKALIETDAWIVQGRMNKFSMDEIERNVNIRLDIKNSTSLVVWRSWQPDTGSEKGTISTLPFTPSAFMAIPFQGSPKATGIRVFFRCRTNNSEFELPLTRRNYGFSVIYLKTNTNWCDGKMNLVANSSSNLNFIAIGTPFEISFLDFLVNHAYFGGVVWSMTAFVALFIIIFPISYFSQKKLMPSVPLEIVFLLVLGIVGYLLFFAYGISNQLVKTITIGVFFLNFGFLFKAIYSRDLDQCPNIQRFFSGTAVWFFFSLLYFIILYAVDSGAGLELANSRFSPVGWSNDNLLQTILAEKNFEGEDLSKLTFGNWFVSDRGPLLSGLYLVLMPLFDILLSLRSASNHFFYNAVGIIMNTLWILPGYTLIQRKFNNKIATVALLILGLSPFFLFNSVYAWPKLLSAGFMLAACYYLFPSEIKDFRPKDIIRIAGIIAVLSVLSLLSHGSTVFGLVPLWLCLMYQFRNHVFVFGISGLVGTLLALGPWLVWETQLQPSGGLLLKYMLTGILDYQARNTNTIWYIFNFYSSQSFSEIFRIKLESFALISGLGGSHLQDRGEMYLNGPGGLFGEMRIWDFFNVFHAMNFLFVGILYVLYIYIQRKDYRSGLHQPLCFYFLGLVGIVLNGLIMWKQNFLHTQSYFSVLLLHWGCVLGLISIANTISRIILGGALVYSFMVWIIPPIAHTDNYLSLIPIVLCLYLIYYLNTETGNDPNTHSNAQADRIGGLST